MKDLGHWRHKLGMNDFIENNYDSLETRLQKASASNNPPLELDPILVTGASTRKAPLLVNWSKFTRSGSLALTTLAAVAVGSLVVVGTLPTQTPLFTSASGSSPSDSQSSELSNDISLRMGTSYNYVAGSGLSTDTGKGLVYQLKRVGTPEQTLANIADKLGLTGEVSESEFFSNEYPSYIIGSEDGESSLLSITWSGTGNWWFNNPNAYPPLECQTVEYLDENGEPSEYEDCFHPQVPVEQSLAPNENEAKSFAADFFASTGLVVEVDNIRVVADEWQTMAIANLEIAGTKTAIEYVIAWASTGEIAWANGHSIEIVNQGEFNTISATSSVERLNDWRWFGTTGPDYQTGMDHFTAGGDVSRTNSIIENPSTIVDSSLPVKPDVVEPKMVTVDITVDNAKNTLLLMWDSSGNAWLVPGFAMLHPDGWYNAVTSLEDGVIELPKL